MITAADFLKWCQVFNVVQGGGGGVVTFPLSLARGGTAAALTANTGGIVYSGASALAILAGTATANLPLLSGSTAAPHWGSFALALGGALTTAGALTFSGAHSFTGTLTANTAVTFPTSGTLATTSQIPSFPLSIANGGTAVAALPTVAGASAFAAWDANVNLPANSFIPGFATTATAAGTTTLTTSSAQIQEFTGTTTQTVVLPVVSTLSIGQNFVIVNKSTGAITVQSSGGDTINTIQAGTTGTFYCVLTSGTGISSWDSNYITTNPAAVTLTPTVTFATPGDLSVSYAIQTGFQYRFGNAVFVTYSIRFTPTYTTASGALRLGGLLISGGVTNWVLPVNISTQAVTFNTLGTQVFATVPSNYFQLNSQGSGAASSTLTTTNFISGVQYTIIISGFYGT